MFIKEMTIEGVGAAVQIIHTNAGALVTSRNRILCEVRRDEDREKRYAKAYDVTRVIMCGECRDRWWPRGTAQIVLDVLNEIERVAGC